MKKIILILLLGIMMISCTDNEIWIDTEGIVTSIENGKARAHNIHGKKYRVTIDLMSITNYNEQCGYAYFFTNKEYHIGDTVRIK